MTTTKRPKFFGIGWPKTGSNSLSVAVSTFGLNVLHTGAYQHLNPNEPHTRLIESAHISKDADPLKNVAEWISQYDFAVDWPLHYAWRELAQADADAKFIVMCRPANEIAFSCIRHNWRNRRDGRKLLWSDNYEQLVAKITAHYTQIFAAAMEQPARFLLLALDDPDEHKWRALAAFLNKPVELAMADDEFKPWPKEFAHTDHIFKPAPKKRTMPTAGMFAPPQDLAANIKTMTRAADVVFGEGQRTQFGESVSQDNFAIITTRIGTPYVATINDFCATCRCALHQCFLLKSRTPGKAGPANTAHLKSAARTPTLCGKKNAW